MKKVILLVGVLIVLIGGFVFVKPFIQPEEQVAELSMEALSNVTTETNFIPTFTEASIDAPHTYNDTTYAFRGSSLIDINNDGTEELWLAGGKNEPDSLFEYTASGFRNIAETTGLATNTSTAGGAISIDIDKDNDTDLIIAREDGIYLAINSNGKFTYQKTDLAFEQDAVPMSITAGDINKDGFVDLYISTFKSAKKLKLATFNNPSNRTANVFALNNGDNTFTDATDAYGLTFSQNTFQASFVDLNNDTWQDLVLSTNTDKVIIYKNNTDGTFTALEPVTDLGFWMGMAIADYDNDGDQDLFFSNVGNTIPAKSARGDLRSDQVLDLEWRLLENKGDFVFSLAPAETGLNGFEFAWGATFTDLNLDGLQDLLVSESYVKWPAHKIKRLDSRLLMQTDENAFIAATEAANAENPYYGTTPLTSDFNHDGYPDIIWANLNEPTRVLLNDGGKNTALVVQLPDTVEYLGSRIDITYTNGNKSSHQKIVGQGLMSDTSSELLIGLGQNVIEQITLTKSDETTSDLKDLIKDNRISL